MIASFDTLVRAFGIKWYRYLRTKPRGAYFLAVLARTDNPIPDGVWQNPNNFDLKKIEYSYEGAAIEAYIETQLVHGGKDVRWTIESRYDLGKYVYYKNYHFGDRTGMTICWPDEVKEYVDVIRHFKYDEERLAGILNEYKLENMTKYINDKIGHDLYMQLLKMFLVKRQYIYEPSNSSNTVYKSTFYQPKDTSIIYEEMDILTNA